MLSKQIANEFKKTLVNCHEENMYNMMFKHYKTMRLIDSEGKWISPELQKLSGELLPKDLTPQKTRAFVDEVAGIAEKNPYLVRFLERAKNEKFENLEKQYKKEGEEVLPDVVAYSLVLEKLTKAMYNNPQIMEDCLNVFQKERKKENILKHIDLFHMVKLYSVEGPVKNLFIKAHKTGNVPKNALRNMLPINILEATLGDYIMGNRDNAKAGWRLAVNRPGGNMFDKGTDAGPATWSADKKAISLHMPLPKEWADLYQTWNMAFCSQISSFPYVLPKLFIPQVAKYQDKPSDYIYNRALALYLHLNYAAFECVDMNKSKEHSIDWADKKLTRLWGNVNNESAKEYNLALRQKRNFNFGCVRHNKTANLKMEM